MKKVKEKKLKKRRTQEEKRARRRAFFKSFLLIAAAVVLYALGVSFFFGPSGLTPGGLSGIAISLERFGFLPFGKGTIVLILNVPILILGIVKFGMKFFAGTIAAILASSGLMELFDRMIPESYTIGPFPAAIGGGVLIGISVGLILRAGATFGGTDVLVKLLHLKYKYLQTGSFYMFVDGAIIVFGTVCATLMRGGFRFENFDPEILIYSVAAIFIQSYFANLLLYGTQGARMLYIITTKEKEISERINNELRSGVTYLRGEGAYTGTERQILLCAMHRRNVPGAKEIVLKEDPQAFMIVTGASQVLGKGFKPLDEEDI